MTKSSTKCLSLSVLVAATAVSLSLFAPAAASGSGGQERAALERQLAEVRRATARYADVRQALADGYLATDECAAAPGLGGMGYHYVNPRLMRDPAIDPLRPEILLYERTGGSLRLVAVEWFSVDPDQDLGTDEGRPSLFGVPFDGPMPGHGPGMPVHSDLHAWIWKKNPAGTFAPFNPNVTCS